MLDCCIPAKFKDAEVLLSDFNPASWFKVLMIMFSYSTASVS